MFSPVARITQPESSGTGGYDRVWGWILMSPTSVARKVVELCEGVGLSGLPGLQPQTPLRGSREHWVGGRVGRNPQLRGQCA